MHPQQSPVGSQERWKLTKNRLVLLKALGAVQWGDPRHPAGGAPGRCARRQTDGQTDGPPPGALQRGQLQPNPLPAAVQAAAAARSVPAAAPFAAARTYKPPR